MRHSAFRERLNQIGLFLLCAPLWVFSVWRLWSALAAGQIEVKSRVYGRLQDPFRFWGEIAVSGFIVALPLVLAVLAIYKLAGPRGGQESTLLEKPAAPLDVAHRRDTANQDIR
jgi:hypothetical protein